MFADAVVDTLAARLADHEPGFTVVLTDADRSREVGSVAVGAPEVRGSAADVAWWLSGRGDGEGLTCAGDLPTIAAW